MLSLMNQNVQDIAFILDRSGSMEAMKQDAIGGFNLTLRSLPPGAPTSPSAPAWKGRSFQCQAYRSARQH